MRATSFGLFFSESKFVVEDVVMVLYDYDVIASAIWRCNAQVARLHDMIYDLFVNKSTDNLI